MTQEELSNRYFIFTKINEQNQEEITAVIDGSLLIPKPKFKVGDRVTDEFGDKHYIDECCYDLSKNRWWYLSLFGNKYYEHELEIVEEK